MNKLASLSLAITAVLLTQAVYADSAKLINPANGHSYQRFDTAKTWTQAKDYCANQGGYLATITVQAEKDWIVQNGLLQGAFITWLGATDSVTEGEWKWITGEPFTYTNWATGEPNNQNNEDYLLFIGSDGKWNDGGPNPYLNSGASICEWEPVKLYSQVATIPDINNGAPKLALLGEAGTNFKLFVYDSLTQTLISESVIVAKKGYAVKSFSVVNDSNGNGAPEVAILINKLADKTSVLQFQDTLSGDIVKTVNLPK